MTAAPSPDDAARLLSGDLPTSPTADGYDLAGRWRTPEPLSDTAAAPPPFPLHTLPRWAGEYAAGVSAVAQTPPDLAGLLVLTCLAVACAKRARVEVMPGGWSEPLNIYAVCAMNPSERKSPVYGDITAPVIAYQRRTTEEAASRISAREMERRILSGRLKAAEAIATSGKSSKQRADALLEAKNLQAELDDAPSIAQPRLISDDVTPEKLSSLLAEHGGRMGLLSSEGDIFATIAGRYSGGVGNYAVYLKGYSDPLILVDRQTRAAEVVHWPALTVGLTVQPSVVSGLAGNGEAKGRGFLARFLWALPASLVGRREVLKRPARPAGRAAYHAGMTRLLELPPDPCADSPGEWRLIQLSDDAADQLYQLRAELEPRIAPYADLADLADWAGKLAGNTARIAGLLHLADHADDPEPWSLPISGETMARAIEIARWAIPHAEAALMPRSTTHDDAEHVLRWLLSQPADILKQSELFAGCKRRGWTARDHLAPALATLEERGWIRRCKSAPSKGRPAIRWEINPLARGGFSDSV